MTDMLNRNLNEQEVRAFKMLATWEELVDKKRLFYTIVMREAALNALEIHKIAQPMRVERDRRTDLFSVRFSLDELARYIWFVCKCVGFTVGIDGEVTTRDGMKLMVPCLNPPPALSPPDTNKQRKEKKK